MTHPITLSAIFAENKGELASTLSGLTLPKDIQEIQNRISLFLNKVCDENNEFRQNLTQSEDYILQAALSMLNAQRDMVSALSTIPEIETKLTAKSLPENSAQNTHNRINNPPIPAKSALLGSSGGALIGKIVFGGWGAVFGAIAGTSIALYLSQQKSVKRVPPAIDSLPASAVETKIVEVPVNTEALLNVVAQLCESLDNLVATFRAQIQRVINKYESQEKPTIEREYRTLLEGIQSLLGYKRGHNPSEEKYIGNLQERIEELAELLDNYNLEAVDYNEEKSAWFDAVESEKATDTKLVAPAIVKNGVLVIKGKVFVPKR